MWCCERGTDKLYGSVLVMVFLLYGYKGYVVSRVGDSEMFRKWWVLSMCICIFVFNMVYWSLRDSVFDNGCVIISVGVLLMMVINRFWG